MLGLRRGALVALLLAGAACAAPTETNTCGPLQVDTIQTAAGPYVVSTQMCLTPPPMGGLLR